jgi:hypothetical protein
MDIKCASCGEPWDTYHLRHDEVHETDAGQTWIDFRLDEEEWDKKMCQFGGLSRESAIAACGPGPQTPNIESWQGHLTLFWREQFAKRGWQFGTGITSVLRCPCCKPDNQLENAEARRDNVQALSELLEGDEDGQAADNELALEYAGG